MEFLLKVFLLTESSAEHQNNTAHLCRICIQSNQGSNLWQLVEKFKIIICSVLFFFSFVCEHKYLARFLLFGKQLVICGGSLAKEQLCESFNMNLCYFSHVTEESRWNEWCCCYPAWIYAFHKTSFWGKVRVLWIWKIGGVGGCVSIYCTKSWEVFYTNCVMITEGSLTITS